MQLAVCDVVIGPANAFAVFIFMVSRRPTRATY